MSAKRLAAVCAAASFILFCILINKSFQIFFTPPGDLAAHSLCFIYALGAVSLLLVTGLGYSSYLCLEGIIKNKNIRQAAATVAPGFALAALMFFLLFAGKVFALAPKGFLIAQETLLYIFKISCLGQTVSFAGFIVLFLIKKVSFKDIFLPVCCWLVILLLSFSFVFFINAQGLLLSV